MKHRRDDEETLVMMNWMGSKGHRIGFDRDNGTPDGWHEIIVYKNGHGSCEESRGDTYVDSQPAALVVRRSLVCGWVVGAKIIYTPARTHSHTHGSYSPHLLV
jgi:hypothetical protein